MSQLEFKYHADSHTGLKRQNNEDAFGQIKTKFGDVFMVCDGMGGHAAGERASQIAIATICEYLANSESQDFSNEIEQAIKHANKSIWEEAINDSSLKGMGTTCVVLYLTEKGELFIGHVGDSRCYIYTKKEEFKTITKDHSYVQFLVEVGEVSEEQAFDHPNKNRILKALGIDEDVSPDVTKSPLSPDKNTLLLLCTDGLNDMLRDNEIASHLSINESPEKQVSHLIEAALEKGGKDNVTVGLLQIVSNPFYSSKTKDETLIIDSSSKSTKKGKRNYKKLLILILLLVAVGLSYYLFKPANLTETNKAEPAVQETIKVKQDENTPLNTQEGFSQEKKKEDSQDDEPKLKPEEITKNKDKKIKSSIDDEESEVNPPLVPEKNNEKEPVDPKDTVKQIEVISTKDTLTKTPLTDSIPE